MSKESLIISKIGRTKFSDGKSSFPTDFLKEGDIIKGPKMFPNIQELASLERQGRWRPPSDLKEFHLDHDVTEFVDKSDTIVIKPERLITITYPENNDDSSAPQRRPGIHDFFDQLSALSDTQRTREGDYIICTSYARDPVEHIPKQFQDEFPPEIHSAWIPRD